MFQDYTKHVFLYMIVREEKWEVLSTGNDTSLTGVFTCSLTYVPISETLDHLQSTPALIQKESIVIRAHRASKKKSGNSDYSEGRHYRR